jgi:hypothetical protein
MDDKSPMTIPHEVIQELNKVVGQVSIDLTTRILLWRLPLELIVLMNT